MKGMEFASSGGDEEAAAFGDALSESVLDEPDAEEQDVGGDDGEGGAGAPAKTPLTRRRRKRRRPRSTKKFEAVLRLLFGSICPIARSKSAKAGGEDFEGEEWPVQHLPCRRGRALVVLRCRWRA